MSAYPPPMSALNLRALMPSTQLVRPGHLAMISDALKQPFSSRPPSWTKAAIVRSAIRPRGDVRHSTQRSQKSRAAAPQPVTGSGADNPEQSLRTVTTLPTDR